MAKRVSARGISRDRVYTLKIAARTIGVSEVTFRRWSKEGLRVTSDRRPYLVRGADIIEFLHKRHAAKKVTMQADQFYCMRCKAPTDPRCGSVTFQQATKLTGRLSAICGECEGKVGRFCSVADAPAIIGKPLVAINAETHA